MLSSAEISSMTAVVASSLDVSVQVYRDPKSLDGYGHTTTTSTNLVGTFNVNVYKPNATQLQVYAGKIAGQKALMMRYMPGDDVREGDRIVYQGVNWRVQPVENAESYTFANDVLITTVA